MARGMTICVIWSSCAHSVSAVSDLLNSDLFTCILTYMHVYIHKYIHRRIQIGTFRPIRVDHTNCLQVAIKTHSFIISECRCDERLESKAERSTRLTYTNAVCSSVWLPSCKRFDRRNVGTEIIFRSHSLGWWEKERWELKRRPIMIWDWWYHEWRKSLGSLGQTWDPWDRPLNRTRFL